MYESLKKPRAGHETTGMCFLHSERDLSIIGTMFEIAKDNLSRDIDYDNIKTYEVEFFPRIKFRNVSELTIVLQKMFYDDAFNFGYHLNQIGQKHGWWDYSKRKFHKQEPLEKYIEKMVKRVHKRFGDNTWIEFDNNGVFHHDCGMQVQKLIWLKDNSVAQNWSVSFLPTLQTEAPNTYKFLISFLKVCTWADIGIWGDDFHEMMLEFFIENTTYYQERDEKEKPSEEEKQEFEDACDEMLSYKEGIPKKLHWEIWQNPCNSARILRAFKEWRENDDSNTPPEIVKEIERMCELLSTGIQIRDYEKHWSADHEDGPLSNAVRYAINYDDGKFMDFAHEHKEMHFQNSGVVDIADSLVFTKDSKDGFTHLGQYMTEFLFLWNDTKTFEFFNEKYKNVKSGIDGSEIRSRALQAKREQKLSRKRHSVRGKSPNNKRRNSSRKTVPRGTPA